ncbi:MAG: cytochrome P450, partial [Rhodospirillaceae bacterium]|nr:cytochrome P450 [Rhodospirillaceae bacterium]
MSDKQKALDFDIKQIDQAFLDDPFPTYKLLREHDPVHLNPDGSYFLSRYDDVVQSFRHPAMSSDKTIDFKPKFGDGPLYVHHTTSLVFNDPPIHTRVRKLLSEAFTPRKLAELEPVIEGIIDRLLDRLADQGEFDVVNDYALALPTEIIADMLGVPEEHRHKLHNYSNLILGALDPVVSPEKIAEGHAAVEEFGALLEELIAERRQTPDGAEMGEVLASLIFGEVDGDKLSPV